MKKVLVAAFVLLCSLTSRADEGMWLVNMIESRLQAQMAARGLKLESKVIYDEDNLSLSDAVVALAFGCSGSMISQDGLMITNHHCAYSDIHALSTPEHNYLEDGFWAFTREQEMPVQSEGIYFLKKVIDVTSEVEELRKEYNADVKRMAMRRVYAVIEKKYQDMYAGQGEVICSSYWGGKRYFMALYQVYKDVRLVAAPPVCIASFGAEVDNWEWPQHKGDFAIYRIYTAPDGTPAPYSPDNVPMHPAKTLKVSTDGVRAGDFVMVMGYPGVTDRYASSAKVKNILEVENPVQAQMKGAQMKIIDKWMNADPEIRLKYADHYFMLSNVQEIREGEIYCYNRFNVVERKRTSQDVPLQQWIDSDKGRKDLYGKLISELSEKYEAISSIERQKGYFRECLLRGLRSARLVNTVHNESKKLDKQGVKSCRIADNDKVYESLRRQYESMDLRVEREVMEYLLGQFYDNVEPHFRGRFLDSIYVVLGSSGKAVCDYIWDNSIFADTTRLFTYLGQSHTLDEYEADPLYCFNNSCRTIFFNDAQAAIEGERSVEMLERQYKSLLYDMRMDKGIPQYADANSTMRITYGTVCKLDARDAVTVGAYTTTDGILEKCDTSQYIFSLKPEIKTLYEQRDWGRWADPATGKMVVDFLSDTDITGGNSGSPVLNAEGELVGLAFDGNKESLAGDTYFDPQMNRTISVDIRYVMWILDKYMGMDGLVDEIMRGR